MNEWKKINLQKNNIEFETTRAILIKMPHNSQFDGFKFWHPKKLVQKGINKAAVTLSYTDEFVFKIFKTGNGRYNKFKKIIEKEITTVDFEEAFLTISENIKPESDKTYCYVKEPEKVDNGVMIPDELKNY